MKEWIRRRLNAEYKATEENMVRVKSLPCNETSLKPWEEYAVKNSVYYVLCIPTPPKKRIVYKLFGV